MRGDPPPPPPPPSSAPSPAPPPTAINSTSGLAPLDSARPKLELQLRRVPLHQRQKELRPRPRHLPHHLVRNQRELRSLPRPQLRPHLLGPGDAPRPLVARL